MADRLLHDRGFGAKHTFNSPTGGRIAWLIARREWPGKAVVETMVMLPLFVPPVATGLVSAHAFQPHGPLGSVLQRGLGLEIVFTWRAVVLACAVMSFPLLVRTAQSAFRGSERALRGYRADSRRERMARLRDDQPAACRARHCRWRGPRLCACDGGIRRYRDRRRHDSAQDDDDFIVQFIKTFSSATTPPHCLSCSFRSALSSSLFCAVKLSRCANAPDEPATSQYPAAAGRFRFGDGRNV